MAKYHIPTYLLLLFIIPYSNTLIPTSQLV